MAGQFIFPKSDLRARGGRVCYPGEAREAAFPLGGIGTGNVSVGARGELRDWEIFNWPGKGNFLPFTFFAVWARAGGGAPVAKILEREITPPHNKSQGLTSGGLPGLPRFRDSSMRAGYPFVEVDLRDDEVPVRVSLEAFTPLVPLNAEDSAIPAALLRYKVANPGKAPAEVSIVGSLANAVGFNDAAGRDDVYEAIQGLRLKVEGRNEERDSPHLSGLFMTAPELAPDRFEFGSLCLAAATRRGVFRRAEWLRGEWTDHAQDFWEDFREDGALGPLREIAASGSALQKFFAGLSPLNRPEKIGSVGIRRDIPPGGEARFEFVIAWHFPNRPRGWIEFEQDLADHKAGKYAPVRNHYATIHRDAWAAADYLAANLGRLEAKSRAFENALFGATLPTRLTDAVAANIASLRSPCAFRIETGEFLGWEGNRDHVGCGHGSVTHVWNYAQTVAFLFPELERSMREVEFNREMGDDGEMPFRARAVLGQDKWRMLPAADGQMGAVFRVWREWKLSGDGRFLRSVWPRVRKAMEFSIRHWDADADGLPEGRQSNTYDIEFYGPNPMVSFIYCAALKGCAEMARAMGEDSAADRFAALAAASGREIEKTLWDGDYFVQRLDDADAHRYQHGIGCHADQLLGQFMAFSAGMGPLVSMEKIGQAAKAVFDHNFFPQLRALHSVQRVYGLNDEAGLALCSWPKGGRPRFAFAYCDEVWTGVEYQVAANLLHAGHVDEALTVVQALRARYDGFKRNPWGEIEFGRHYVRAMASFGLLTAFSGQRADLVNSRITFRPLLLEPGENRYFWICGKGWGTLACAAGDDGKLKWSVEVLDGSLDGIEVVVEPRIFPEPEGGHG